MVLLNNEKELEKLNQKLAKFMANPRLRNFDAIVDEMERHSPGQGIKEKAEELKKLRGLS